MNFDPVITETVKNFQMTPPRNSSNNILSSSSFCNINKQRIYKHYDDNNSSTYDDHNDFIDTDSDFMSSENDEDDGFGDLDSLKLNGNLALLHKQKNSKTKTTIKSKKMNNKKKQRQRSKTDTAESSYLAVPNNINESDDNYDKELIPKSDNNADGNNNDDLPKNNKMHLRSYSESNLQKDIQENTWPSSASSDDSFDESSVGSDVYSRYVEMKKKYKKQRRISQQFQDAITVIQDDNEDSMLQTEQQIRDNLETEYEMKLIQLERQKLNNAMHIEDKMKYVLCQNDELMIQNKQLQQQVAAQVAMIQQQQQIALQQQLVRMHSKDSLNGILSPASASTIQSPLATLCQFPTATTPQLSSSDLLIRRISSASNINIPAIPCNMTINAATNSNLGLKRLGSTPSIKSEDDNYTLNPMHFSNDSTGSDETNNDAASVKTDTDSTINSGDLANKYYVNNMEPAYKYKYKVINEENKKKRYKIKAIKDGKWNKLHQLETKLLLNDNEIKMKIGDGQTPWDRFFNLMTPSFCSCSPAQNQQKSIAE